MPTTSSVFVDTSGWLLYADQGLPLHSEVMEIVSTIIQQNKTIVTTNYIVSELVALLTSRLRVPRAQLIQIIDLIKTNPHLETIHIDSETDAESWDLLKRRVDKAWSLVDASSFVIMQRYGITQAITADHHFTQAGFIRLPAEVK